MNDMKLNQLVALIVRFFVIYLFLSIVFQNGMLLITLISQYKGKIGIEALGYSVLLMTILIILGLLWKHALLIAKKIIPEEDGGIAKMALTLEDIQTLCFTVLGFWITIDSLVTTVQYILNIVWANQVGATMQVHLFGYAARLALGIWITLGAKSISKFILKLRE